MSELEEQAPTQSIWILPLAILPKDSQWASLDRGGTLTKLLYITEADAVSPSQAETRTFQCVQFANAHFPKAIEWLKTHAYLPKAKGKFHVTGLGGLSYRKMLEEILELEVLFVDEFLTQMMAAFHCIRHFAKEEICFPPSPVMELKGFKKPDMMRMAFKYLHNRLKNVEDTKYPAIMVFLGSGQGMLKISEDESHEVIMANPISGKSFMGLAKALVGTAHYDELFELANRGFKGNVDSQIKDVMSPEVLAMSYGSMPLEVSVFPFGKLADKTDKFLNDFRREDVAAAHVAMTAMNICQYILTACAAERARNIYIGGNMIKAQLIRNEMTNFITHASEGLVKVHFFQNGHTGALGTMVTSEQYQNDFFERMFENSEE